MKTQFHVLVCFLVAVAGLRAQVMNITSTGLGLGTTTPGYLLDVEGGSAVLDGTHGGVYTSADQSPFTATGVLLRGKGSTPSVVAQTGTATSASAFAVYNSTPAALLWVGGDGNVGVSTTNPSIAGGFTPKLHLTGAYAAIALESTAPAEKWGIGVDSTGAFDIFRSTSNSYAGRLLITNAGNVGIGTASPGYKLEVNGSVRATSFVSNSTTYADFVFKPGYKLAPLADIEAAILRDGHLPDIPSEADAKAHGIDLAAQQVRLLQKVEELTLYVIEHEKGMVRLQQENAELRQKLDEISHR